MIVQENAEDFEEFNCEDVLEEEELFHNVPVPYHLCSMIWTSISINFYWPLHFKRRQTKKLIRLILNCIELAKKGQ